MILAVLTMGGIFLAATVVAGVLMTSQIRQATDLNASTAAIAAADAGIEWALYKYTHPDKDVPPLKLLTNTAEVEVVCHDKGKTKVKEGGFDCKDRNNVYSVIASGKFRGANRIFTISEVKPFVPPNLPPPKPPPPSTP